jgi:hypothetical protein
LNKLGVLFCLTAYEGQLFWNGAQYQDGSCPRSSQHHVPAMIFDHFNVNLGENAQLFLATACHARKILG